MMASQMRAKGGRIAGKGASGLDVASFMPNDSDRELVASFEVNGKWLDCIVAELSYWDGDEDSSGYYVYVIDGPDGDEVADSGQDSWTSMDDAIDAAIEHCDDIAENPGVHKLSRR